MEAIFNIIQYNPEYFAWVFGVVNVFWGLFMYFNKQSHDKALAKLKHELTLDADRRKKVFELKATQYEAYVENLDEFGKKHQVDMPARMQPIFDKCLNEYLAASQVGDKEKEREIITWFSSQISSFMQEGLVDVLKLQSESNKLKLAATDEMIETFTKLEHLTKASMDKANEFMGKFTEIVLTQNNELSQRYQDELKMLGAQTQTTAQKLMQQMRAELNEI
ncbi:hypothetical protein A3K86_10710 [Photobacterium jeanii]|uniref:Uncharacterized protein n=1 Tax=Photobacterium jeanii TaxID=858640 RepID=A0A178KH93_9GAMM|nr:hypothetical protein [Photobacterium jeanii]OAN16486.1 hypothetical protein A3K86_10710 [Photobacterium jeanii]PST85998.1 hypothetical protein C9I91_22255 [Photobacterium jeanii]